MAYESKQAILEEAGLNLLTKGEVPSGAVNSSNTVFTVANTPITDRNYDDQTTVQDVTAYVNGSVVAVSSVNVATGQITLAAAPATGTVVTVDYNFSPVPDQWVENVREEAQGAINDVMDAIETVPYDDTSAYPDGVPATVRKITRYYAAGLLLVKDYGFNNNSSLTSKDGDAKITRAELWLDNYEMIGGATGLSDVASTSPEVDGGIDLFATDGTAPTVDELFMIGRDFDDVGVIQTPGTQAPRPIDGGTP